jgi:hypothetical protein
VVDDDFISAIGSQRCLNSRGDGTAGIDIAKNSSILGLVAVGGLAVCFFLGGWIDGWVER